MDTVHILEAVAGVLLGLVTTVTGFLVRIVFKNKDDLSDLKTRLAVVESATKDPVTVECVREVISQVFDQRDKIDADRRAEWDTRTSLQIRQAVHEEIERSVPRIVREVRGTTGIYPGQT